MALALNFHKTFIPERRFLQALLAYVAQGKSGSMAEMAAETGIPMGRSTGKLPAILNYALGMGLIQKESLSSGGPKRLALTPFGQIVYLKDPMLSEPLTQWMVHFHLCLPDGGAKAWHLVFGRGRSILGSRFTTAQLEAYLVGEFGHGRNRTGPLVRTYVRDEALGRAGVLRLEEGTVRRNKAPLGGEYAVGYAAFATTIMERAFGAASQVALTELEEKTRWFSACLWDESDTETALSLMERTGFVSVDRQVRPYLLEKMFDSAFLWPKIYLGVP